MSKNIFDMLAQGEGAGNSSTPDSSEKAAPLLDRLLTQPAEDIPIGQYILEEDTEDSNSDVVSDEQEDCGDFMDSYAEVLAMEPEDLSVTQYDDPETSSALFTFFNNQQPESISSSRYDELDGAPVPNLIASHTTKKAKVLPPNIADGLGNRQEAKDFVALEDFLVSQADWMLYDGCLCLFQGSCWVKFKDKDKAIREIRQLLDCYGAIRETLTASDYRRLYYGLLSNPRLDAPENLKTPANTINCLDGTLDLLTLESHPHRPQDYFFYCFNLSVQDVLEPPMHGTYFETYVSQISNNNPGVRRQLLELLSIAMTGTQLKYFFAILGPSNTGKSQFPRFAQELLGHKNVESISGIDDFGNRFTTSALYGKLLVTCGDLPKGVLPEAAIGVLKQYCGDDAVKGEYKHGASFTYYQKPLVVLVGNHPIKVRHADSEDALLNRLIIIPFADSGVEDAERIKELYLYFLQEAPYIVHEAAIAFQDLVARNWMPTRVPVPAEYAFQEGDSTLLGIQDFIENCISSIPGAEVSTADLFQAYCDFTLEGGCHQMNATTFSRSFSAAIKQLIPEATPTKRVHGTDSRGYVNIALICGN
ncbi:MAG: DUF5906 domain-containing protein [Lawsonibacter sp.]|nr:DUF5906 domain-containing protein [Lawsonibacter sp.]